MSIPTEIKDQAIYHSILAEMHRLRSLLLNRRVLSDQFTAASLEQRYSQEQSVTLGKITEWRQRRPQLYAQAKADFETQVRTD